MRWIDIVFLALGSLGQHKVRTALTLLGVILSSCILVFSLSLGNGIQDVAETELRRDDRMRRIDVMSGYEPPPADESKIPPAEIEVKGKMSEERRDRLRKYLIERWRARQKPRMVRLTREHLDTIARLDHVVAVTPMLSERAEVPLGKGNQPVEVVTTPMTEPGLRERLVFGRLPASDSAKEAIVSEAALFNAGIVDDDAVEAMLGKPLQLEFQNDQRSPYLLLNLFSSTIRNIGAPERKALAKVMEQLPAALDRLDLAPDERQMIDRLMNSGRASVEKGVVKGDFTLVGVLRVDTGDHESWRFDRAFQRADVVLPAHSALEVIGQLPRYKENGLGHASVLVDSENNVRGVSTAIRDLGLREFDFAEYAERVYREVLLIRLGMIVLALVALLIAALGLTNTMVTSVLERTREIGVMKAVGARDRQVLGLFLIEGSLLGMIGGVGGAFLAWVLALSGEQWMQHVLEQQTGHALDHAIFQFPLWLVTGGPAFTALVTLLAAVLPARRAARIDPVIALRSE